MSTRALGNRSGDRPVAVVTGANRGIGLEICRQLAGHEYEVILTAREANLAEAAAEQLRAEALAVVAHRLDVLEAAGIEALRARLAEYCPGRLQVLVNNAGIMLDGVPGEFDLAKASALKVPHETLTRTLETNTLAPYRMIQALAPLMVDGGAIVNLSSGMGQLSEMGGGWPGYRVSKTALNALTRIFADELRARGIRVNSVCPGWVRTRMGGPDAARSPVEGADTVVWLATRPAGEGPTGGFFRDRKPIAW